MGLIQKGFQTLEDLQMRVTNELYNYYRFYLDTRASALFGYENHPKDCDTIWFENVLTDRVTAAFLRMENDPDPNRVFSLAYNTYYGYRDFYNYPAGKIMGITANQYRTQIPSTDFVVCYDNIKRIPIAPYISMFALLMWEVHNTFRSNLMHQNKPFIIPQTPATKLSTNNIWNQFRSFAPYINVTLTKGKTPEEFQKIFNTIDLRVEFKGKELLDCLQTLLDMFDNMVGITSNTDKRERISGAEMQMNRIGDAVTLNSRYLSRKQFVEKCNERGFHSPDGEMKVFINPDPLQELRPYNNEYFENKTFDDLEAEDDV